MFKRNVSWRKNSGVMHSYFSYEIMLNCWIDNPTKRPTFSDLRSKFDGLLASVHSNPYIDLKTNDQKDIYNFELKDDDIQATPKKDSSPFKPSPARSTRSGHTLESEQLKVNRIAKYAIVVALGQQDGTLCF